MSTPGAVALFSGSIGPWEILIVLVVLLLVFGRRIPEVMRSLGKGVTQFKKGLRDIEDQVTREIEEDDKKSIPHDIRDEDETQDKKEEAKDAGPDELQG